MQAFTSLNSESFRKTVLVFFAMSSLLPILILLFVLFQHVYPALTPDQAEYLMAPVTYGLVAIIGIPLLGFFLIFWWIKSLENLTADIKIKSAELLHRDINLTDKNEMVALQHHFDTLYQELQTNLQQLNEHSQKLSNYSKMLAEMAVSDKITGLSTRRHFDLLWASEVKKAETNRQPLALIMTDVVGFRKFLDSYGKSATVNLLRGLAMLVRDSIGRSDMPFRYGPDVFAIILRGQSLDDAAALAQKLVDSAALLTFHSDSRRIPAKAAIRCGIAASSEGTADFQTAPERCLKQTKSAAAGAVVPLRQGVRETT